MKSFRNVPAIITLSAGFIISVIMIIESYDLVHFLWILVAAMVGFYLVGVGIRFVLIKTANQNTKEETDLESEEETEDEKEEDQTEAVEDSDDAKTSGKMKKK